MMIRKILNFLFDFFTFLIDNQTSITSVRIKIFLFCKKYFQADAM